MTYEYRKDGAGPDPFDGETIYPDAILDEIERYLNHIKRSLGLADWTINVSRGVPSPDAKAETFLRVNARQATVAIGNVMVYPESERRITFIHELLHAAVYSMNRYVRQAVDGVMAPATQALFDMTFAGLEEDTVDAIARAIWPLFDPSPDFSEQVKEWEGQQAHEEGVMKLDHHAH